MRKAITYLSHLFIIIIIIIPVPSTTDPFSIQAFYFCFFFVSSYIQVYWKAQQKKRNANYKCVSFLYLFVLPFDDNSLLFLLPSPPLPPPHTHRVLRKTTSRVLCFSTNCESVRSFFLEPVCFRYILECKSLFSFSGFFFSYFTLSGATFLS